MRRREFITLLGGAAATWPLAARAQQSDRMRRIGILAALAESDTETQTWVRELIQRLQELGWTSGRNFAIDSRFGSTDMSQSAKMASELIELQPDVIVAIGSLAATALRQQTLSIPIVFVQVPDPVSAGFVTSLARPEGNITGFTNFEFSMGGMWLQLLTECAPGVGRAAVVFDPDTPTWSQYLRTIEAAAPKFAIRLAPAGVRNVAEIEQRIAAFAREPNGALIVLPSPSTLQNRASIIAAAAQVRLPAVYHYGFFTESGGLISYGIKLIDLYKRAASYVDRILKGTKLAELPVEQPTTFELVINLKTAKALGLTIPPSVLTRADRVIE